MSFGAFLPSLPSNCYQVRVLLIVIKSDKDLFEVLCADEITPPKADFQIPFLSHIVLMGQLKLHEIEVECTDTTYAYGFTPPRGAKTYELYPCSCPCSHCPCRSLWCMWLLWSFYGLSAVAVYQKQVQVRQAAAQAHLQQVGIIIVPGVIPPPQVVSGFIPSSVPAAVPLLCFRLFHSFSFVPE